MSKTREALEYVQGNLAAWRDDPLPKQMKAQIGESLKELRFAMNAVHRLEYLLRSWMDGTHPTMGDALTAARLCYALDGAAKQFEVTYRPDDARNCVTKYPPVTIQAESPSEAIEQVATREHIETWQWKPCAAGLTLSDPLDANGYYLATEL